MAETRYGSSSEQAGRSTTAPAGEPVGFACRACPAVGVQALACFRQTELEKRLPVATIELANPRGQSHLWFPQIWDSPQSPGKVDLLGFIQCANPLAQHVHRFVIDERRGQWGHLSCAARVDAVQENAAWWVAGGNQFGAFQVK